MQLPTGAVTGAIIGVLVTAALLFAVPSEKGDKLTPIVVKPIAMVPLPAAEPAPIAAPAPEAPPVEAAPPPAKPDLHPRPHDKSPPAKVPPPGFPAQPPPVKPAAVPARPTAMQCFKVRQEVGGMTPAEQQAYVAKYMTAAQSDVAKACLGTK